MISKSFFLLLFPFFLFYRFTGAHAAELLRDLGGWIQRCIPIPPHPYIFAIFEGFSLIFKYFFSVLG